MHVYVIFLPFLALYFRGRVGIYEFLSTKFRRVSFVVGMNFIITRISSLWLAVFIIILFFNFSLAVAYLCVFFSCPACFFLSPPSLLNFR